MITEVSPYANVVLDGSGNGQVSLGPPSGAKWALRLATLAVSTSTKQPQGLLYRGSASGPVELIDSTYTGAQASSTKVGGALYYPGQLLWAKWTGGDPGATATLQVYGQQGGRTDPLSLSPPGEGFANPVVAGTALIIPAINSPNFVTGSTGWSIKADGSAEFANVSIVGGALVLTFVDGSVLRIQASGAGVQLVGAATGAAFLGSQVTGDPPGGRRFTVTADGHLSWGSGAGILDTTLARDAVGELAITNALALIGGASGANVFRIRPGNGTNDTMVVDNTADVLFGSGFATPDTHFGRAAAGVLYADVIKALIGGTTVESWHGLTLQNGFTNRGAGFPALSYRAVAAPANGVQICGQIVSGATVASGTVVATLPAGYLPATEQMVRAVNGSALGNAVDMSVTPGGNLTLFGTWANGNVIKIGPTDFPMDL